jgi:DNA-binding transcriptional regulator YiaG
MVMLTATQIRALREFLGMSRTEFAVKLSRGENTIARWEGSGSYSRHPRRETMGKINELLREAQANGFQLPATDPAPPIAPPPAEAQTA